MTNKTEELTKLERIVNDGEQRLKNIKINLDALDKELSVLGLVDDQLTANIICLKSAKIVAIASEFKKARDELVKTKQRLAQVNDSRLNFLKSYDDVTAVIKKTKEQIEEIKNFGVNNVIYVRFRRKNG